MQEQIRYYTSEMQWKSIRDAWRRLLIPIWLKPIAILWIVLRRAFGKSRVTVGFPRSERLEIVDQTAIPPDLLQRFEPFFQACQSAGFTLQFVYLSKGIGAGVVPTYSVVLQNSVGTSLAMLADFAKEPGKVYLTQTQIQFSIQSPLADGSILITSRLPKYGHVVEEIPSHWQVVRLPSTTTETEVISAHQSWLDDSSVRPVVLDLQSIEQLVLKEVQEFMDFGIDRGWYRPLTEDEVDALYFAEVEQQKIVQQRNDPAVAEQQAKSAAKQKRLAIYLWAAIVLLFAMAFTLGRLKTYPPLAQFVLKTPKQTIAFEITRDFQSIRFGARQQPPGPDSWRIERPVGLIQEIGTAAPAIEPDLDQQRVHFHVGNKALDFDLRLLDFVPTKGE